MASHEEAELDRARQSIMEYICETARARGRNLAPAITPFGRRFLRFLAEPAR